MGASVSMTSNSSKSAARKAASFNTLGWHAAHQPLCVSHVRWQLGRTHFATGMLRPLVLRPHVGRGGAPQQRQGSDLRKFKRYTRISLPVQLIWRCGCQAFAVQYIIATHLPCVCHAVAMRLPCVCHAVAMRLPCGCQRAGRRGTCGGCPNPTQVRTQHDDPHRLHRRQRLHRLHRSIAATYPY